VVSKQIVMPQEIFYGWLLTAKSSWLYNYILIVIMIIDLKIKKEITLGDEVFR